MQLSLLNALYLVLFSQTFFFGLFLLFEKKQFGIGLFFSALAGQMLLNLAADNGTLAAWPQISVAWGLLYPVSFYFYFKQMLSREFCWQPKALFHLLPWLIVQLLMLFAIDSDWLMAIVNPVVILSYFVVLVMLVKAFAVEAKQHKSINSQPLVQWAVLLLGFYPLVIGFPLINDVVILLLPWMNEQWLAQLQAIVLLTFVNLMIGKWLKQPTIFVGISAFEHQPVEVEVQKQQPSQPQDVQVEPIESDSSDNLQMEQKYKALAQKVDELMSREFWYRQANLTLKDVAERLASNEKYISSAINSEFGQNFSEYVNRRRVDEAMQLLIETEKPITDIFYQVGFNSKASFNLMFKKFTETTPSQFRKQNKSKMDEKP